MKRTFVLWLLLACGGCSGMKPREAVTATTQAPSTEADPLPSRIWIAEHVPLFTAPVDDQPGLVSHELATLSEDSAWKVIEGNTASYRIAVDTGFLRAKVWVPKSAAQAVVTKDTPLWVDGRRTNLIIKRGARVAVENAGTSRSEVTLLGAPQLERLRGEIDTAAITTNASGSLANEVCNSSVSSGREFILQNPEVKSGGVVVAAYSAGRKLAGKEVSSDGHLSVVAINSCPLSGRVEVHASPGSASVHVLPSFSVASEPMLPLGAALDVPEGTCFFGEDGEALGVFTADATVNQAFLSSPSGPLLINGKAPRTDAIMIKWQKHWIFGHLGDGGPKPCPTDPD